MRDETSIDHERLALPSASPQPDEEKAGEAEVPVGPTPAKAERDREKLQRVFAYEGDRLRLIDLRLKGRSRLDTARRLTYLFLYAHKLDGRERVPRTDLYAVLKDADLYEPNSRNWTSKSPDLLTDSDLIGLRSSGVEQARKTLAEVLDPSVQGKWSLGARRKARGTKPSATGEGAAKASRHKSPGRRKTVNTWLTAWKARGLAVNGHAILKGLSNADKGIFGLWAIREAVGEDGKIVGQASLARFLYEAFDTQVEQRNLGRALENVPKQRGLVLKVGATMYQITPSGIEYAKRLAASDASTTPTPTSPNGSSATVL